MSENSTNFAGMEQLTDEYYSILNESKAVYREKASRFLAFAFPVETEEEVKLKLDYLRKEFYDANHHCYAYRLGHERVHYRVNDDGEPSGSAGKPIYGQILSLGLSDVLAVVVRYFGGTKLGVAGLINAYKTSAREALELAGIKKKIVLQTAKITFEYPSINVVMKILKEEQVKVFSQTLDINCELCIGVRKGQFQKVQQRLLMLHKVQVITL
jgi:uncharacterized YigZ family protein